MSVNRSRVKADAIVELTLLDDIFVRKVSRISLRRELWAEMAERLATILECDAVERNLAASILYVKGQDLNVIKTLITVNTHDGAKWLMTRPENAA